MLIYEKVLSTLNTASGTRVSKYLQEGNKVLKRIQYSPNSRMAKMGIDNVMIEKAGEEGKRIFVVNNKGTCIMKGKTKPSCISEGSILDLMRVYVDVAKEMLDKGIKFQYNLHK